MNMFASMTNLRVLPNENRKSGEVVTRHMTPEEIEKYKDIKGNARDKKRHYAWEYINKNKKGENEMKKNIDTEVKSAIDNKAEEDIELRAVAFVGKYYTYDLQTPGQIIVFSKEDQRKIDTDNLEQTIIETKAMAKELELIKNKYL